MIFTDGTLYKGNWHRGLQTGKATMTLPDGTMKEGYFSNNIFYGEKSPSPEFDNPRDLSTQKLLRKSYSQNRINNAKSRLPQVNYSPQSFAQTLEAESGVAPIENAKIRTSQNKNRTLVSMEDSLVRRSPMTSESTD